MTSSAKIKTISHQFLLSSLITLFVYGLSYAIQLNIETITHKIYTLSAIPLFTLIIAFVLSQVSKQDRVKSMVWRISGTIILNSLIFIWGVYWLLSGTLPEGDNTLAFNIIIPMHIFILVLWLRAELNIIKTLD